jgi:Fur family ferric uptake transcriptional regulator
MANPADSGAGKTRMTRQRRVILEELQKVTSHPTADTVYELVRRRIPTISLGTVYRNLEILARTGRIAKLEVCGCQKRFDGNPRSHDHIRCVRCGKVDDMSTSLALNPLEHAQGACGYKLLGYRLEFVGLCPRCQKDSEKGAEPKPGPV